MNRDLLIFDVTSEFPPDADLLAKLQLAAASSRKEVDRRWTFIGRATRIGMMVGGTTAAGVMWMGVAAKQSVMTQAVVADAAVGSVILFIMAAVLAYILIMGLGGFYAAAAETYTFKDAADLEELGYERHSEKCVEFVKLCRTSEVVRHYQNQLVAMGRRPVVGEYEAARRQVEAEAERRSQETADAVAQRACAQLNEAL